MVESLRLDKIYAKGAERAATEVCEKLNLIKGQNLIQSDSRVGLQMDSDFDCCCALLAPLLDGTFCGLQALRTYSLNIWYFQYREYKFLRLVRIYEKLR